MKVQRSVFDWMQVKIVLNYTNMALNNLAK